MNSYEIEFRKAGNTSSLDRYNVIAESLEDALTQVKTAIPNDFGSEYRYELVSARETARELLIPRAKSATARK